MCYEKDFDFDTIKYIVEHGADVNIKNVVGMSSLFVTTYLQNIKLIRYLLHKGADINTKDNNGITPLIIASLGNNLNIVKLLVKRGSNVNIRSNDNYTALEMAQSKGNDDIVEYLKHFDTTRLDAINQARERELTQVERSRMSVEQNKMELEDKPKKRIKNYSSQLDYFTQEDFEEDDDVIRFILPNDINECYTRGSLIHLITPPSEGEYSGTLYWYERDTEPNSTIFKSPLNTFIKISPI